MNILPVSRFTTNYSQPQYSVNAQAFNGRVDFVKRIPSTASSNIKKGANVAAEMLNDVKEAMKAFFSILGIGKVKPIK